MKYPFVEIRFILNDNATPAMDHTLDLKRVNNVYVWNYHDPALKKHHVMYIDTMREVYDAFTRMVNLLAWDTLPFKCMQVTAPAMPPIMVDIKDVPTALDDIYALLSVVLTNPPVTLAPAEVIAFMANDDTKVDEEDDDDEEDEDEDDEDDEDEEDEDEDDECEDCDCAEDDFADLPPLIPISQADRPPAFCTRSKSAVSAQPCYSYFS